MLMISLKPGTQTQFNVTVLAVIACLSAFLLFIFVGVGAAHLALAGRTQFLFSRRDLLHEMSLPLTLSILSTLSLSLSSDELSNSESESDDSSSVLFKSLTTSLAV